MRESLPEDVYECFLANLHKKLPSRYGFYLPTPLCTLEFWKIVRVVLSFMSKLKSTFLMMLLAFIGFATAAPLALADAGTASVSVSTIETTIANTRYYHGRTRDVCDRECDHPYSDDMNCSESCLSSCMGAFMVMPAFMPGYLHPAGIQSNAHKETIVTFLNFLNAPPPRS
jgi:hypothetical protein